MTLIAIGLNHRSAPLDLLERMALSADHVPKALAELATGGDVTEVVVLATCNRTEIYASVERFHDGYREIRDSLGLITGVAESDFVDHLYVHYHDDAIEHLFTVAAGLDSAVLGEHEILGQVKTAWETARIESTAGTVLNTVFEHAVRAGKRVRTETTIGRRTASISHAAVRLVEERIGDLAGKRVLLVGAGEVGAGVANALRKTGSAELTVTNRTAERAERLAESLGARSIGFAAIDATLVDTDVLITATGAPGAVLFTDQIDAALAARAHEDDVPTGDRLLILDLAVPRDVEAGVAALDGVGLLTLGDLQAFANRGLEERQKEVAAATAVVADEIDRHRAVSSAKEVAPLLGGLHRWADAVRLDEIDRYRTRLGDLDADQLAAVEALTKALIGKVLHEPSSRLKDAAGSHRGDRLAESMRELFDLS